MEPVSAWERLISSLTYIIFFLPMVMLEKTEFTIFHAKQALTVFLLFFLTLFIRLIPFLGWILAWLIAIALAIITVFLIIKAYQWEKFLISPLFDIANRLIVSLKLEKFYTPET